MLAHLAALFTALLVWWVSTGLILWVNRRPGTRLAATVAAFAVLALSLLAIHLSRDQATAGGAYVAFLAAIGVWGFANDP